MFLSGHAWVPIVTLAVCAFIADLILKMGNYSSIKNSIISPGVFILGIMGNMLPFFILRDAYMSAMRASMGNDYVNVVAPFLQTNVLIVLIILTFICGLISAHIGKIVLKKHFEKAGIA